MSATIAAEVRVCLTTVPHILHDILGNRKLPACWIPHEISEVYQWHRCEVAQAFLDRYQREGEDFLGRNLSSLIQTKLETPIKWMEAARFSSSKESAP